MPGLNTVQCLLSAAVVKFPLWRKKVDGSLFQHRITILPVWVYRDVFKMDPKEFSNSKDSRDPDRHQIPSRRQNAQHAGWITTTNFSESNARSSATIRFSFEEDVAEKLQQTFPMSHFREIERRLRHPMPKPAEIEEEYPFFEFLDIEWEASARCIHLTSHFTTPMQFDNVFQRLQSDGVVDRDNFAPSKEPTALRQRRPDGGLEVRCPKKR